MSAETLSLPAGYGWQYQFLLWIQSFHSARLDSIGMGLSWFGTEWFYILVLPILFWSINKTVGLRIAYVFLCSMYFNGWLKDTVQVARPVGVPGIRSLFLSSGPGYSFPSAHAQGPATLWTIVALWAKRVWFWCLVLLLVFAIGVSRVYLGLHWPMDVIVGLAIGLGFAWIGWFLGRWWTYRQYAYPIRMTFAIGLPVLGLLIHPGIASLEYASLLLGTGVGAVIEERHLKLALMKAWWKRVCCAIIGLAGLVALYLGFRYLAITLSSGTMEPAYAVWMAVRDVLMGLWGTLGAPYVFWQCGLHEKTESAGA